MQEQQHANNYIACANNYIACACASNASSRCFVEDQKDLLGSAQKTKHIQPTKLRGDPGCHSTFRHSMVHSSGHFQDIEQAS